MRNINIQPVLNGYICQVGCQRVVFNSRESLILALGDYLAHPEAVEKSYLANAINKMTQPDCPPTCDPIMRDSQCAEAQARTPIHG